MRHGGSPKLDEGHAVTAEDKDPLNHTVMTPFAQEGAQPPARLTGARVSRLVHEQLRANVDGEDAKRNAGRMSTRDNAHGFLGASNCTPLARHHAWRCVWQLRIASKSAPSSSRNVLRSPAYTISSNPAAPTAIRESP